MKTIDGAYNATMGRDGVGVGVGVGVVIRDDLGIAQRRRGSPIAHRCGEIGVYKEADGGVGEKVGWTTSRSWGCVKGEMILRASSRVRLEFGGAVGAVSILKGVNNAVSFSSALRFFKLCCRVRVIRGQERGGEGSKVSELAVNRFLGL
ncbi:hypothetical protein RHGRI_029652 [Rhododendron griersonianum]|uniref:Uncharacterized protein n=1 Tax=Rhododendron griersonianum TaxID=479676 RepID=A0AAV6IMF8_9ERIC|nr:hypothetical protein RHGRI_029652 [Rhododendron griersonianum]